MLSRLEREQKMFAQMVVIYCRAHHATTAAVCPACAELRDYAAQRLRKCRFQAQKPVCAQCPTHCYKPAMRDSVRAVMRYAGPRMIYKHPISAFFHFVHRWTVRAPERAADRSA